MTTKTKAQKPAKKTSVDLRKPQIRILQTLAKTKEPLSRADIAKKAKVDAAWLTEYVGSSDRKVRLKNDKRFKSLITRGFVKAEDSDGATTYTITAAGRKAAK